MRNRRGERPAGDADPSPAVRDQAVRDAEAIVCLAWAEELLRRNERTAISLNAARQEYQAASERLVATQYCGDPRRISAARAMLEDALEVHRAQEAASEHVRLALRAVLGTLARTRKGYVSAARRVQDGEGPATPSTATPDPSRRRVTSGGGVPEFVGRVLRRLGRLAARRVPDPGRP